MQGLIDDVRLAFFCEYNLDILFSGDRTLIEAYYDIKNEGMHEQLITERNDKYFSEKLKELQRRVNKNASMSRHYHDIWTYVNFWHPIGKWQVLQTNPSTPRKYRQRLNILFLNTDNLIKVGGWIDDRL